MSNSKIGTILLAAGGSRRLGRPKQLLDYEGCSMIKYAAVTALIAEFPTVVVLGASAKKIEKELIDLDVGTVINADWKRGISSSIIRGLSALKRKVPDLDGVIIMLCDQPRVSPRTLQTLEKKYHQTGMPIVASVYDRTAGVPALFGYEMFGELMTLEGDKGAQSLISKYEDALVTYIDAPEASFDVDTPEDAKMLVKAGAA